MSLELGNVAATALVAVAVAMFARRRGWGIALPLIGVGALMSVLPVGPNAPDSPELFQVIVLAPLVFGEALGSSYIDIRKVRRPVMALAIGLVAATTLVVGGVMAVAAVAIPAAMCFALGAVVAPTDAVAVATAARRANLPQRLVLILEGESLVNDGTGLTALRVAVTAAVAGSVTLAESGVILAQSVLVGVGVGVVTGFVLVWVLRRSSDLVGSGGLLLVAPFIIYVIAEDLGGSEILAIVVAGLMASHSTHSDPSYRGRLQVAIVWKQITFLLQAVAFLLLGLDLPVVLRALTEAEQTSLLLVVPLVVVALIVTRLLFVTAMIATSKWGPGTQKSDWRHGTVMGWAGARGPVSALAAFSIPFVDDAGNPLAGRNEIVAVALCTIVITLLLAPTLGPLARRLGVCDPGDPAMTDRVRIAMARAALKALDEAETDAEEEGRPLPDSMVALLRAKEENRLARTTSPDVGPQVAGANRSVLVAIAMAQAEQSEILRLRTEEGVPDSIARPLLTELDRRIALLRQSPAAANEPPPAG